MTGNEEEAGFTPTCSSFLIPVNSSLVHSWVTPSGMPLPLLSMFDNIYVMYDGNFSEGGVVWETEFLFKDFHCKFSLFMGLLHKTQFLSA